MKNKKSKSWAEKLSYFTPESDEPFKKKHPIGYGFLVALGIFALLFPLLCFTVYITFLPDDTQVGGWPILAIIGCIVMGVGLFNIVAIIIKQYLGHLLTAVCLGGGGLIVGLSVFMIEHPELYDGKVSLYYFISLFMMLIPPMYYLMFRVNYLDYLSKKLKIRERSLRKRMKGMKNFWWYQRLHEEYNIGFIYHLNRAFILSYVIAFAVTLLLGFVRALIPIICVLNILLYILTAVIAMIASAMDNLMNYGSVIVLLRRHPETKRIDSTVLDIFAMLFILAIGWVNLKLCIDVFTI